MALIKNLSSSYYKDPGEGGGGGPANYYQFVIFQPGAKIVYDNFCQQSLVTSHLLAFYFLPVTCHLSPVTCHLSPATYHLSSVTCHLSSVTCHPSPITCHLSPVTCRLFPPLPSSPGCMCPPCQWQGSMGGSSPQVTALDSCSGEEGCGGQDKVLK